MYIKPFAVEEWMNAWETKAKYNIAETCVDSVSVRELFRLTGTDEKAFWDELASRRMTYGDIEGAPALLEGISGLHRSVKPENIITTHGAAGANHHVFYSLVEPGDRVISVMPTYQQLYSIPESFGADVHILKLRRENGFLPDLDELRGMCMPGTKLICINNPNNPSGALMDESILREIADIARRCGAYLMCDEVYRGLTQEDMTSVSIADIYEKGISVGSMSKVFSLAGLRLGWIATRSGELIKTFLSHRDYDLISCGIFDEAVAAKALAEKDAMLARGRTIVRENLSILDRWVNDTPGVSYVKPKAGTTALVYYDLPVPSHELCLDLLKKTGVLVTPGSCFGEEYSMRIGYAYGKQSLIDGLEKLGGYLASVRAGI